jgi:hypothetical protein
MIVKNVLSGLSSAANLGRVKGQGDAAARKALAGSAVASAAASAKGKLRDIASQYDVTNITPQAFSDMLQKLHQSGALPDKDFQDLSGIRQDLDRDGVSPNQTVNLVDLYSKKLSALDQGAKDAEGKPGSEGLQSAETTVRQRLNWLQKFATIHAAPKAATINALA